MAITGHQKAQLIARAGVLRAGTGRAGAIGDAQRYWASATAHHVAGSFKYSESPSGEDHQDSPTTTYTQVVR